MKNNDLEIIYENDDLAVINKPANLLTHPAHDNSELSLVTLILEKWPAILNHTWPDKTRMGIIHRLDKDTSGLIIIAKNPTSQKFLQEQFKSRTLTKKYQALCMGKVTPDKGTIKTFLTHSSKNYTKQKSSLLNLSWQKNKNAITHYETFKNLKFENNPLTLCDIKIETGRTHQIRNHMQYLGFPIIGDQVYFNNASQSLSKKLDLARQFLHSYCLKFNLLDGKSKEIKIDLPKELQNILKKVK